MVTKDHEGPPTPRSNHSSQSEQLGRLQESLGLLGPAIAPTTQALPSSLRLDLLREKLAKQLHQHHGCPPGAHTIAATAPSNAVSLGEMAAWECLDVLAQADIAQYPTSWDTLFPSTQHQRVFSGISVGTLAAAGDQLPVESPPPMPSTVDPGHNPALIPTSVPAQFDIDSTGGFASSLAVARDGFH